MSDYMFILENHLSGDQSRVVAFVQAAASEENVAVFLTGGAMRDMLGGSQIRDLDFTVEGNAIKLAKDIAARGNGTVEWTDEHRKVVELSFPGGLTCSVSMARHEKYSKPGAKPQITPANIHEDLLGRDFTINSIALSLNRGSRGLLIDPTNGLADLERRELRATGPHTFYDDPARLLRLVRFRTRLAFAVDDRTQSQYQHAREAGMESRIPPRALFSELRNTAEEMNAADVVRAFEQEKLLGLYSPALTGAKLNYSGLAKVMKAKQLIPFGVEFPLENLGLFMFFLTEKLSPKEKAALIKATEMGRSEVDAWQKLEAKSKKLEAVLKSARLKKPSQVYTSLQGVPGEEILFLLIRSQQRIVQERIKTYLQKYLPAAQEVTDTQVEQTTGFTASTPKFKKAKLEAVIARLDAKPKKVVPPPEPLPATTPVRR